MPLFWLSIAFISGILAASIFPLPAKLWVSLAGTCAVLPVFTRLIFHRRPGFRLRTVGISGLPPEFSPRLPGLILLAGVFMGAARWQSAQPVIDSNSIAYYNNSGRKVAVEGVILLPPDERDTSTYLLIQASQIQIDKALPFVNVEGRLQAKVIPGETWHYGERIRLDGELTSPPEGETFSYQAYLGRQGVYSIMEWADASLIQRKQGNPLLAAIYGLKGQALHIIYRIYPDPEASLLAGILLGVEKGIPAPVREAFDFTGTSHIIAISGFNMTIIAGLFAGSFGRMLGPRKGAVAAVVGISV